MARPRKSGLIYFYFDVDTWDNYKIIELTDRYGPLGFAIYNVILCEVYKNGYYLEIPLEQFATSIARTIGNRWIRNKDFVLQVIQYCADIGLLDNALLSRSVITSAGIQQRYSEVTARSKADKSKYWLLEPVQKKPGSAAAVSAPETGVFAAETDVFAAKTPIKPANIPQRKEKKSKANTAASSSPAAAAAAGRTEAEEAFAEVTGRKMTEADRRALGGLKDGGIADALIAGVIRDVGSRRGQGKINSFAYFIPAIREAARGSADTGLYPATAAPEYVETVLDEEYLDWLSNVADDTEEYDYDDE